MSTRMTESGEYRAAMEYLSSRIDYERSPPAPHSRVFKLDRMRQLAALLGNPQDRLRIVHVAGTKGKGSTAAMIAESLTAAGYRTGLYTSPHLTSIEQRWRVDGQAATQDELAALVAAVRPFVEQLDRNADAPDSPGRPTFFEVTTAMAFVHFLRCGCYAAVLEVGLGGRLDATNICHPDVTVITTISFDHTQLLGSTLAAIAGEKAGILKPGVPVVTGVVEAEPLEVIARVAQSVGGPLFRLGKDFDFAYRTATGPGELSAVDYWETADGGYRYDQLRLAMHGRHQAANAAVALAVTGRLIERGWKIPELAIRRGLAAARCLARIEIFPGSPTFILDAAHNVASVEALLRVLDDEFRGRTGRLVFAVSADKDFEGMLRRLIRHFEFIYLTRFVHNPRSVSPVVLAEVVQRWRHESTAGAARNAPNLAEESLAAPIVCDEPRNAWEMARRAAQPGDYVCIAGSFFLAAELRELVVGAANPGPQPSNSTESSSPTLDKSPSPEGLEKRPTMA